MPWAEFWRDLLVALGFRKGEAAGRDDQRSADIAAANVTAQEITDAHESGPGTLDDAVRLLRDHDRPV